MLAAIGVVTDMANVERAAIGLRTATTALGVHRDSAVAVVGKQAAVEFEEGEQSARMAAVTQCFLADAECYFARTAVVTQCFLADAERYFARMAVVIQCFLAEAVHCFARTAAVLKCFLEEAGIEADCCHMRNWVVMSMLQWKKDSKAVAGGYCVEAVIETDADTHLFGQCLAGRLDLQRVADLHSGLSETALSIGRLYERCTFHHR